MKKFQLELYTRPTCSDCQAGKEFLSKNDISYIDYDLTKHPSKEDELIKITGTRIVPAFVFKNKSLLGLMSKPKVLIGFEKNIDEIRKILNIGN
ncbi:glutaredoxin family protein [Priestia filamentosa]|uniref:glutaredoxin family protein n=1 Tax=Priestia filamentosa TaxID=1402861 RepID=UPI00397A5092